MNGSAQQQQQWGISDSELGDNWDSHHSDWKFGSNDSGDQSLYDDSNNKLLTAAAAPVLGSFNRPISLHDDTAADHPPKVSARDLGVLKDAAAKRRALPYTGSNLSSTTSGSSKHNGGGKSGKKGIMGLFGRVRNKTE